MWNCLRVKPRQRSGSAGFTLMEMVVTLALVGLMALVAWPAAEVSRQRAQELELRRHLRDIRSALDAWKAAVDDGRIAVPVGASPWPPSLQALADGVPNAKDARGGSLVFLRSIPRDPFAAPELSAAQSWTVRSSKTIGGRGSAVRFRDEDGQAARDVFDVRSRSERRALDGSRLSDW